VHISVPPLRARKNDVKALIDFFLRKYAGRYRREGPVPTVPERLMQSLLDYGWPGNVRQLENVIRRWVVLRDERYVLEELRDPDQEREGMARAGLDAEGPMEGAQEPQQ